MTDKRKSATPLALMILLIGVISASGQSIPSQGPPQSPPVARQPGEMRGDPIRQLNLTAEQREQIRLIREQNREERMTINQRVRETNRALEELLETDSPDENLVEQRMREAGAAQAAAMRMRILTELKIRRVLTEEQRTLLRTFRQRVHESRTERRMEDVDDRRRRRQDNVMKMRERRRNSGRAPLGDAPPAKPLP